MRTMAYGAGAVPAHMGSAVRMRVDRYSACDARSLAGAQSAFALSEALGTGIAHWLVRLTVTCAEPRLG